MRKKGRVPPSQPIESFQTISIESVSCASFLPSPFSERSPSFLLAFSFSFLPSNGSLSSVASFSQLSDEKRKGGGGHYELKEKGSHSAHKLCIPHCDICMVFEHSNIVLE